MDLGLSLFVVLDLAKVGHIATNLVDQVGANIEGERGSSLPLTDSRGRCQGCGNRCYPVKPNCKKRQRALARLGY